MELFWNTRKGLFLETLPDLYVFLAVDTDEGFKRAKTEKRRFDHFERRPHAFHERVREGYAEFLKTVPHVIVDANRPLEAVQDEVLDIIRKYIRS